MFAVIKQGGKQYRVEPGDVLRIERIPSLGTPEKNQSIELADVRMLGEGAEVTVGSPTVEGATVKALEESGLTLADTTEASGEVGGS